MLASTIERLRAVALAADDASGYFPAMYAQVTAQVGQAVERGRFADGERLVRFTRAFADRYPGPPAGTQPVATSWRAAWDVADDDRLLIVQHLLLGINAHVNHDLPQVVVDLADADGDLAGLRPDFDAVNDVLATTFPHVLRATGRVSGWVNLAAAAGGGRMFNFSLTVARARAWQAATRIHGLDDGARRADVAELDRLVTVLAYLVTRPARPLSWLVPIARRLEVRDPRAVTASLLGDLA